MLALLLTWAAVSRLMLLVGQKPISKGEVDQGRGE